MTLHYDDYCFDELTGAFRQRDVTATCVYDAKYLDYYARMDEGVRALAARRLRVLEAFAPARGKLLDYGAGTFRFVEAARDTGWDAWGYDVVTTEHPRALDEPGDGWDVVTLFDVLEHLPDPLDTLKALGADVCMVSVPWCHYPWRRNWFMNWRHRKPGEHLHHWNRDSLGHLFALAGYESIMHSCFEDDVRSRYDPHLPNILTAIYRRCDV